MLCWIYFLFAYDVAIHGVVKEVFQDVWCEMSEIFPVEDLRLGLLGLNVFYYQR